MFYFLVYFTFISLTAIIMTVYDKLVSKGNSRRISEKSLIAVSLLGGAFFMYAAMKLIRHKTKHAKFMIGLPAIVILHMAILMGFLYLKGSI